MRAPLRSFAAFVTLLVVGPTVSYPAPADTAKSSTECMYRDAKYGPGAVICVAPAFGQQCADSGKWSDPASKDPFDKMCAGAKIEVPGTPQVQCLYHNVKYTPGARICVAPKFGMTCGSDGGWSP